ncbi:hypothetical protein [Acidocella facilis]|uniref:hypothetical protein n=1 Tax=Acidocella facilis TaxID=525 RepID=UPI001F3750E0|nr:hypothetical protein [Acidocella facilis]
MTFEVKLESDEAKTKLSKMTPGCRNALIWMKDLDKDRPARNERQADYTLKGTPVPATLNKLVELGLATVQIRHGYPKGRFFTLTEEGQHLKTALIQAEAGSKGQ